MRASVPVSGATYIVGRRVRERRIALGLSESELALRIGTARPNVYRIESGVTRTNQGTRGECWHGFSLGLLCRLAVALECDIADLVKGVHVV